MESGLPNMCHYGQFSPGASAKVRGRKASAEGGVAKYGDLQLALGPNCEDPGDK